MLLQARPSCNVMNAIMPNTKTVLLKPINARFATVSNRAGQPRCDVGTILLSTCDRSRPIASQALLSLEMRGIQRRLMMQPLAAFSGNGAEDTNCIVNAGPSERTLACWRKAETVCFNIDGTLTKEDSLELLAKHMGMKLDAAADSSESDGPMSGPLEDVEARIKRLNATLDDVNSFLHKYGAETQARLVPGAEKLIRTLQARGVDVYLMSSGFRELNEPIAQYLGVPDSHLLCNSMKMQVDGSTTRVVGVQEHRSFRNSKSKLQAVAHIKQRHPYTTVAMIGDGISDKIAGQAEGGADLFIAYAGVYERAAVARGADWVVHDFDELFNLLTRYKVAMVGSGAWACAAMHLIAQNLGAKDEADEFYHTATMWVYEEEFEGRKLSEVINERQENPKYLPGVGFNGNVRAVPVLVDTVKDADIIVFCAPHQFMHSICKQLIGNCDACTLVGTLHTTVGCTSLVSPASVHPVVKLSAIAISLVKGMRVRADGPQLVSAMVNYHLGIDCSVLMGANIASDIGAEKLGEAVIGYGALSHGKRLAKLFSRPYFRVTINNDPVGAEMCGTLKNIVALAAGMVDGQDLGPNTKATIMRQGLWEMKQLSQQLYPAVRDDTFLLGCGVGDLIATCYGGRNLKVATEWTKSALAGKHKTFDELEDELLAGQKLQGVLTSNEVQAILHEKGWELQYPLFTTVNRIIHGYLPVTEITRFEEGSKMKPDHSGTLSEDEAPQPPKRVPATSSSTASAVNAR